MFYIHLLDIIADMRLRMSSTIATLATSSCSPARGGVVMLAIMTLRMMILAMKTLSMIMIVMVTAQASSVTRS